MFLVLWLQRLGFSSDNYIPFVVQPQWLCVDYGSPGGCVYTGQKKLESNPEPFK